MNIPLNGRIAIVDDKIDQALPLINVLAQKRCPYLYYSGELKYLPHEGENQNDIRVLFLDINLIDDRVHSDRELKSRLIPVLSKVISRDNYPYVLIYWSRNEEEYANLVKEIFENDLTDRKPIAFLSQNKLSYFDLDGERTAAFDENVSSLFSKILFVLNSHQAYKNLINWETKVHLSADITLQEIFSSCHTYESWSDNAGFLIDKLGESFSGKRIYKALDPENRLKSSFQAFNNVFIDTLEYSINNSSYPGTKLLSYNPDLANRETIFSVNKKLLLSDEKDVMEYSGAVIQDLNPKSDSVFEELLNNVFNRKRVEDEIIRKESNINKPEKELNKIIGQECSSKRRDIRLYWKKIYLVVTPLCDFVQKKYYNTRVVKGMLIKANQLCYIDERSEAIFISPKFKYEDEVYVIVLHFRYFFTAFGSQRFKDLFPLFRVRQQLLAEIQSKLARHISRQGVLFIDEL